MKRATMTDVARLAGCSKAAVSYCFSGRRPISENTREKIYDAAQTLNYIPYRIRKGHQECFIVLLVNDSFMSFLNPNLGEFVREIYARGLLPAIYPIPPTIKQQETLLFNIGRTKNIVGIINLSSSIESFDLYKWSNGLPSVIFIREKSTLSPIQFDYGQSMKLAIDHLKSLGHRNILFLTEKETISRLTVQSYLSVFRRDKELSSTRLLLIPKHPENKDLELLDRQMLQARGNNFSAIVVKDGFQASRIYQWCALRRVKIPEDLSIISLENSSLADWFVPKLAIVQMPTAEITAATLDAFFAASKGEKEEFSVQKTFHPFLQPGKSTAPPPSGDHDGDFGV